MLISVNSNISSVFFFLNYSKLRTQAIQPNACINDPGPTPQELIDELSWSGRSNEDYLLNLNASIMAESTQPVK